MKSTIMFVCQECGYETSSWLGKCPECGVWNSLREFQTSSKINSAMQNQKSKIGGRREQLVPKKLDEVVYEEKTRIKTGFSEMDGVLGGGIVSGSVVLLAGDPGIGKSTLLLQAALKIGSLVGDSSSLINSAAEVAHKNFLGSQTETVNPLHKLISRCATSENSVSSPRQQDPRLASPALSSPKSPLSGVVQRSVPIGSVLYISGEESEEQIKLRAQRIVPKGETNNLLLLSINDTDAIIEVIEQVKPSLVIIDSIQTMESENLEGLAGSVGQVRYAAFSFIKLAKSINVPIILVGHVTKDGMVAGPMVLSHMVDVVLFLEGEKNTGTRILRSFKNRFGPIDEVGIFIMEGQGMKEIKNPEEMFINQKENKIPGSVLVVTMEGTRAFLVEIQALAVFSKLPMPRRVASGIDYKRLELLIAVLQKHCRLPLETSDVFVNVVGGLKLSDPAVDLGICLSIYSSLKNISLSKMVAISEVGLLGELRSVGLLDKRIKEAKKLGFKNIVTSGNYKTLNEVIKSI